jgi:hypothetical protein
VKIITLNNNGNKVLKSLPTKTIVFNLFQVNSNIKDLIIRCPYDGNIVRINANTSNIGTITTELIVEKINNNDFKNKLNTWTNILSRNILIQNGQLIDDEHHIINDLILNKDDYLRVNLVGNSDLKNLSLEIEIEVI